MNRRIIALTITAAALLGLTACTGAAPQTGESSAPGDSSGDSGAGSGDSSQSVADACAVIQTEVDAAMTDFEGLGTESDPQTLVDAMTASAEALTGAIGQIGNEEVAAAAQGLQEGFAGIAEATKAVLIDGDVSQAANIEELGTSFQESFTAFQELCLAE